MNYGLAEIKYDMKVRYRVSLLMRKTVVVS